MSFKTSETYIFRKLFLIRNYDCLKILFFNFISIFLKNKVFFSRQHLYLKSTCISYRNVDKDIFMNHCLFNNFFSTFDGGVIYISSTYSLNINDTTFYQCISSGNGGAIYFTNGLNVQLFRICAVGCKSYYGQFAWIQTHHNHILDLITINNCGNTSGTNTLIVYYGNQNISNINISYNNVLWISGIIYYYLNSMFSNFCTFYNNTDSYAYGCIYLSGNKGTISKANFILYDGPIVVYANSGDHNLFECIFDQNKNILLSANSGSTLQLNNCYYLTGSTSTIGSIINLLIPTSTDYLLHSVYSTFYCSYYNNEPTISNTINPTISDTIFPTICSTLFFTFERTPERTFPVNPTDCSIFSKDLNQKSNIYLPIYISFIFFFFSK